MSLPARTLALLAAPLILAVMSDTPAAAGDGGPLPADWSANVAAAKAYARHRPGTVGFAVRDDRGSLVGAWHERNRVSSASVIKSMLLVAYLRRADVRGRALLPWERQTLRPMIRRSKDSAASEIFAIVGQRGLRRLARAAGLREFAPSSHWGLSQITAADMTSYFFEIGDLAPPRHRAWVLRLLGTVLPKQQWGIPPVAPTGWVWHIKGGWLDGVVNQVALFTRGSRRFTVAVLIEGTPDTEAGVQHRPRAAVGPATITGVAARLLSGLGPV